MPGTPPAARLGPVRDVLVDVTRQISELFERHRAGRTGYITRDWGFMTPGGLGGTLGGKFTPWEQVLGHARTFFPDIAQYRVFEEHPAPTALPPAAIAPHQHDALPGNRALWNFLRVPPSPAVALTAADLHDYRDASRLFILIGSLAHLASNCGDGQPVPQWIAEPLLVLARRLEVEPALSGHFMVVDNWQWRATVTGQTIGADFGVDAIELLYPAFGHSHERTYHTIPGCMAYALRGLPYALHDLLCAMRDHAGARLENQAGDESRQRLIGLMLELAAAITRSRDEFQRITTHPTSRTHVSKHVFIRHMQPFHKGLVLAHPDGSLRVTKGMSGLHFVSYHLLDAVLGRYHHGRLGELARMEDVDAYYPRPQREYSACLAGLGQEASLRGFLDVVGADTGLRRAFNRLIECYAGETGALAAHARKLFSYMHNNVQVDTSAEGAGVNTGAAPTPEANHGAAMRMFSVMNEAVRERRRLRVSPLYAQAIRSVRQRSEDGTFAEVEFTSQDAPLYYAGSDVVYVLLPRDRQSAERLCSRYFAGVETIRPASLASSQDAGWSWQDLWEALGWPDAGVPPMQVCEFIERVHVRQQAGDFAGTYRQAGAKPEPAFEPVSPRLYSACGWDPDRLRVLISRPLDAREHYGFERMTDTRASGAYITCAPGPGFTLPPPGSNLVMVAGGTGVSPFVSLVQEIDHRPGSFTLIHQTRTAEAFLTHLGAWRAFTRANAGAVVMGFVSGQAATARRAERFVVAGGEIVEHRRLDSESAAYYFLDEQVAARLRAVTQPSNNFAYCCGGVQSTVMPMREMLASIGSEYEFEIQSYGGDWMATRGSNLFKAGDKLIDPNHLRDAHPGGVRIIEQMSRLAHRAEGAATTPDLSALFFELHPYAYNLMRLVNTPSDAEFESFAAMIEREAERGVVFDHIAYQYVAAALAFPGKLNIVKIALKLELVALDSHLKTARSGYPRKDAIGSMGEIVTAASASAMNCLNHIEDLSIHLAVDDPDRPAFAEAVARAREQLSAPAFVFDARTSAGAEGAARIVTLELRDRAEGDVMILSISGRLDTNTSPRFSAQWQTSRGQGFSAFVVDLAGLDYISSMGLRVLLVAAKQSKVVVCSMSPLVQKIFDLGGFARYMKTAGSIEQALALIRGD